MIVPSAPSSPVPPCISELGSHQVADAEIAQHFAARHQIRVHPLTPEELQSLETALNGGIPTNTTQLMDLLSLIFRQISNEDLSERQRKALKDIAHRLPDISQAYLAATAIQSAAQESLDRLNALKTEEKTLLAGYDENITLRQAALTEEETWRRRIGEIDASRTQLQHELELVRARHARLEERVKQISEEQSRVIQRSKPLARIIKESTPRWEFAEFQREHYQDAMQQAAASWKNFRLRLAAVPAADPGVDLAAVPAADPAVVNPVSAQDDDAESWDEYYLSLPALLPLASCSFS